MTRFAKIVATLGPASSDEKTLTEMVQAGLDVARLRSTAVDAALPFVLPQSGTYRLLVESSQGGITTGSYLLTVMVQ